MRYQFIQDHQNEFPVQRMCSVLGVSASGYYAWQTRPVSQRAQANEKLLAKIRAVHSRSRKTYGSPRVHAELVGDGFQVGKNRVARLMRAANLCGQRKRKQPRTTNSQHRHPVAPNHLNRDFHTTHPNEKWLADTLAPGASAGVTYIPTAEGWLYLAVVLDLFSRKIVGWAFSASLESNLVEQAFRMAIHSRPALSGLFHHSDRGSQYAGDAYQQLLIDQQIQVSMSRTGNSYDNAPMESFFSTLKCEHVHFQSYQTRQEAQTEIFAYIMGFYNRQRRHLSLGYISPDEFERRYYTNLS